MQPTSAILGFIALSLLWPALHLMLFLFRFQRLPPSGLAESLVFLPMGMVSALVLLVLRARARSLRQRRRVTMGYLLASPLAFAGSLLAGLILPPLAGTLAFGTGLLVAGMLLGFVSARQTAV